MPVIRVPDQSTFVPAIVTHNQIKPHRFVTNVNAKGGGDFSPARLMSGVNHHHQLQDRVTFQSVLISDQMAILPFAKHCPQYPIKDHQLVPVKLKKPEKNC